MKILQFIQLFIAYSLLLLSGTVYSACIDIPNLKLCDNTYSCPDGYHLCNSFDTPYVIQAIQNNYTSTIRQPYYTSVDINGKSCYKNNYSPILAIEPEIDHEERNINSDSKNSTHDSFCYFDNRKLKHGEGIQLSNCIFCACDEKSSFCMNTCEYSKQKMLVNNYKVTDLNILHAEQYNDVLCERLDALESRACCKNNSCVMPNCISCQSYGVLEICNQCENNYYMYKDFETRCYSLSEIREFCMDFFSLDDKLQSFECLHCQHGVIDDIRGVKKCVCHSGYYGT